MLTRLRAAGFKITSGGGRFLGCARTREMRRKVGEIWISLVVFRMYVRRVRKDILEIISVLAVRKTPLFEKENVLNKKSGLARKKRCAPLEIPLEGFLGLKVGKF